MHLFFFFLIWVEFGGFLFDMIFDSDWGVGSNCEVQLLSYVSARQILVLL